MGQHHKDSPPCHHTDLQTGSSLSDYLNRFFGCFVEHLYPLRIGIYIYSVYSTVSAKVVIPFDSFSDVLTTTNQCVITNQKLINIVKWKENYTGILSHKKSS
ncbi:hypothetical protein CHARACLAT_013711 [Characodon lateralis]|uniref:Uncharacterized protein n=1 Tax=Characodon lateralis TaxID=208331 RepID=A0ABU7CR54_9TELE|nr:hypothetical protein [Characodon lateralis]